MGKVVKQHQFNSSISNIQQVLTLEFGLDRINNNLTYIDLEIDKPFPLVAALRYLISQSVKRKKSTYFQKSDYNIWREKRILKVIDRHLKTVSQKEDYLLDDLRQIEDRRDDMMVKMRKQMSHYQQTKYRIPDMIDTRNAYNQDYFPGLLAINDENLVFSIYSVHLQSTIKVILHDKFYRQRENHQLGQSSFEINYQFVNSLSNFGNNIIDDITLLGIHSNKVRTKNLQGLNLSKGKRFFEYDDRSFQYYQLFNISDFLLSHYKDKLEIKQIELNRSLSYSFIHQISHIGGKTREVDILLPTYSTQINQMDIDLGNKELRLQKDEIRFSKQHKLSILGSTFDEMRDVIVDIERIVISYISANWPYRIEIFLKPGLSIRILGVQKSNQLDLHSLIAATIATLKPDYRQSELIKILNLFSEDFFTIDLLRESIDSQVSEDVIRYVVLDNLFQGKLVFDGTVNKFTKNTYQYFASNTNLVISKDHILAGVYARFFQDILDEPDQDIHGKIEIQTEEFSTKISFTDHGEVDEFVCSCSKRYCYHFYALFITEYLRM